jgi:hypothetical protein
MRKVSIIILSILLAFGGALPARAENSIACTYLLMRIYHEHMKACGTPLPAANEARYVWMKGQLEKFIRDNAPVSPEKVIANVDEKVQKSLENIVCNSMDFARAKSSMETYTSSFRGEEFKESIAVPRNPMVGSCADRNAAPYPLGLCSPARKVPDCRGPLPAQFPGRHALRRQSQPHPLRARSGVGGRHPAF